MVVKPHVELTLGPVERPLVLLSAEPFLWHCDPSLTYHLKASKTMKGDLSSGQWLPEHLPKITAYLQGVQMGYLEVKGIPQNLESEDT